MSDQPYEQDPKAAKQKAYSKAQTRLRQENPDLWHKVLGEEYAKAGIEWQPPLTADQKAEAEVKRLLEANPNLAPVLAKYLASQTGENVPVA